MENKEIVLSVKDLKVNFSTDHGYVQAVRGISFDLYKGETLCIVGESGSGKSVTSKTIMGILASNGRIVGGSIMYQGEDLTKVSEDEFHRIRGNKIGMIFQDPLSSLNPIVRIGKQITEAMLINSSRLKKLYEEKIADELVAYKNAQTGRRNELNEYSESLKFLKSEKKKEITKARNLARNEKADREYSLKQEFGGKLFNIKHSYASKIQEIKENAKTEEEKLKANELIIDLNEEREQKAAEVQAEYENKKAEARLIVSNLKDETKDNVARITKEYDDKITALKNATNGTTRKDIIAKYAPILAETKAAYKKRCKEAKKEVNEYRKSLVEELNKEIKAIKADNSLIKEEKDKKIQEAKDAFVAKTKITKKEAKARALKVMAEVGISEPEKRFKQYPFEFSGGMRQRIVIAIALTADPDILICDEPTTALDVTIQAQILELINRLKKERNLSCIFITHDLGVVANMADRVAVMYAGKVVEYGTENEIFYDPKHPYTWALLSSIPDVDSKERLDAIPGTPPNMIYPPKGDAFALRSKYAMAIDFKMEPPLFKVSETHYAATWLLDPRAPKVEMPAIVKTRIQNSLKKAKSKKEEGGK